MKIGWTAATGAGGTDLLLAGVADRLTRDGLRLAGTVQINSHCGPGRPCDMDVRVLPAGPVIRISQSLGTGSRGCRLDPAALEQAVGEVLARIEAGADALIVNKFGKHEADGRGFRPVIAEALARDVPVLVGLGRLNRQAFDDFAGGFAEEVAPDADALCAWLRHAAMACATAG